jgi:ABC-type lipoprotein release transport system permease subunit
MTAAVALLLLITCANLAGLLLVKTGARERELSVRLALGASQRDVLQQVFTEGVLLALAGGLLGILVRGRRCILLRLCCQRAFLLPGHLLSTAAWWLSRSASHF